MNNFIAKKLRKDLKRKYGTFEFDGLCIVGPEKFQKRIAQALESLKEKDQRNYKRVNQTLCYIIFSDSNSGGVSILLRTYFVRKKTAFDSKIDWLSSLLVHEALHVIVKNRFKGVSEHRNELAATRVQVRSLQRLGREISNRQMYLESIMRTKWWAFPQRLKKLFAEIIAIIRE
jgi:hypothetical protein